MTNADSFERQMLDLINAERVSRGLDPVQLERNLNQSAEDHSKWMLRADVFSHTGAGGSSLRDRIEDTDFDIAGRFRAGENIAIQSERGSQGVSDDVIQLHEALMDSPGHRANILNANFDLIGIGIERGDFDFDSGTYESVIVTQNFASTGGSPNLDTGGGAGSGGGAGGGAGGGGGGTGGAPSTPTPPAPRQDDGPTIRGTKGKDTLAGTGKDDTLIGLAGHDRLNGRSGDDLIKAGSGNDRLNGGAGEDRLIGGQGKDVLDGGKQNDVLTGGRGQDTFVFKRKTGDDQITDFQDNVDAINLRAYKFDSIAEVMRDAEQDGSDVVLNLRGGDSVIVEDITLAALENDLLI